MADIIVSSGQTSSGLTLSENTMQVLSGGTATKTKVDSRAYLIVSDGGVAFDTRIYEKGICSAMGAVVGVWIGTSGRLDLDAPVSSGGNAMADNIIIESRGTMKIYSGGTATNITAHSGGSVYVREASVTGLTMDRGAIYELWVGSDSVIQGIYGDSAFELADSISDFTVESKCNLFICDGVKASSVTIAGDGQLFLNSGGTATSTMVQSRAYLSISSGGMANSVFLGRGGQCKVVGTLNYAEVSDYGWILANAGGVVRSATVDNHGDIIVRSGGTADKTTVNSGGELNVSLGGMASNTTVNEGSIMTLSGGTANRVQVNSSGTLVLSDGGSAISANVGSLGSMFVSYGGVANNTTVDKGGLLFIKGGGFLNQTVVSSGGFALVDGTTYVKEFVVNGGNLQIRSGGVMVQGMELTVMNLGKLTISEGGIVDGVLVQNNGQIQVESGGSLGTAGISSGKVIAKSGAMLNGVFLNSGALLSAASGAVLRAVCVSSGGVLTGVLRNTNGLVFSGGTLDLNIAKGASEDDFFVDKASFDEFKSDTYSCTITVAGKQQNGTYKLIEGATGFNTTVSVQNSVGYKYGTLTVNGGAKELSDGITYDLKLSGGDLVVTVTGGAVPDPIYSGGTLIDERKDITSGMSAIDVQVSSGGILNILSSGFASNTTVYNGGEINVHSDGNLNGATVRYGGSATLYEDAAAHDMVVAGGTLVVESGAFIFQTSKGKTVTSNIIVSDGGKLNINGGWVEGALISGGDVVITSDGSMYDASVANGTVQVKDGAYAGMTILYDGVVTLASGGTGSCTVSSGGTMCLEDGSDLNGLKVYEGGVVTGVMHGIYSAVSFYGGTLDFDISNAAPSNEYLYDLDANLDFAHGMSCTLTVDAGQEYGTYNLMESAYGFDTIITPETPLTVKDTDGLTLATIFSVGSTTETFDMRFTLDLSDDYHLTVTVEEGMPLPPEPPESTTAKSDIDGNGISDVMFVWTGNNYAHGYWMNGTNEWRSENSNHPAEWDNLGCYDMTGDGKADSVLFGNVTSEAGIKGAYIGYYADANDLPDGSTWVNIGYLNNVDNIDWKNKIGNLTGNASGVNSIVWYAPELYALGVWTDGTENWVQLSGDFGGDAWTLVGCGDFTGDGKDQVVMALNGGELYYAVGIDGTSSELSKSDNGWAVRAIGDFSGDGKDDIVAFHKETGLVAMWGDGDAANWSKLGQLDAEDWFVIGAGDYNGDGNDDLLVRQKSTGMLGYYGSGDMAQWVELGRGVDMAWTVIA